MFIDTLNEKFQEFYSEKDLNSAKKIYKEILDLIDSKGLDVYEIVNDSENPFIIAFNKYFSTFNLETNPNKDVIEILRLIVLNSLKYES